MISSSNNPIGSPGITATVSGLFDSDSTDVLSVGSSTNLLDELSNKPNNITSIFVQNIGTSENLYIFVGPDDTGFVNGTVVEPGNGISVQPLGNQVYVKASLETPTDVVCMIQYSTVAFPPIVSA